MIEFDERLSAARELGREWAQEARPLALALDRDPDLIHQHLDLACMRYLRTSPAPREWIAEPATARGYAFTGTSTLERVVIIEELAVGDPGLLLAAPGPSLSGGLILALGDQEQQEAFYGRLAERPTWTFFGLSEPERGSDAGAMTTSLTARGDGSYLLNGAKRYVGNAARADFGVVFARTGPGPLGVTAVLVETADPGFKAVPIPTIGLRANQICAVEFHDVVIEPEQFLGRQLPRSRRGMWGALRSLNTFRPGVAALALGITRAAVEYAASNRGALTATGRERLVAQRQRLDSMRQLIHHAAVAVDASPAGSALASAAKGRAARLAETTTQEVLRMLGPGARLDHPLLDKLDRDARGVEFMEGTGHIHRLNLFQGILKHDVEIG